MAVGVIERGPGFGEDGLGIGGAGVELLQLAAEPGVCIHGLGGDGGGGVLAGVGDAIDGGLGAAAADGEIHGAVLRMDDDVGEGQGLAVDELLLPRGVAGAGGGEVDGIHGAVGPVVDEEGALVFRGELGAGAEGDAGGAAEADVDDGGEAVGVVAGPLAGAAAPAELGAAGAVVHAGGAIPGGADVPLHVGVVAEELALGAEGDVELVAEAGAEELEVFAIGIHGADVAAGGEAAAGVAVGIPEAGQELILTPLPTGGAGGIEILGEVGVVAAVEEDACAIGADGHGVEAVLATAFHGVELVDLVELVVAAGVGEAVEAVVLAVLVDHDVEAVEGVEEAVGLAHVDGELLGLEGGGGADGRDGHAVDAAVLVAGDEAALLVDGEGDPGALLVFGHVVEELDVEAGGHGDLRGGDGFRWGVVFLAATFDVQRESPGALAVELDHSGGPPLLLAGGGGLPVPAGLHEHLLGAVCQFDLEAGDEGGDAAFVARVDEEFILLAGLDVLADVHLGRLLPVGIGQHLFAVEEGLRAVVARQLQRGGVGVAGDFERMTEGDGVVLGGVLGEPDPLGSGGGGERQGDEAGEGQVEWAQGGHEG